MQISRIFAALLCAAAAVHAVETKTWQQGEMADFEKGTLTRLSLSSDGRLALAPVVKEIYDPSVTFLWAIARDSKGNLYAGGGGLGGSKAKLIRGGPVGQSEDPGGTRRHGHPGHRHRPAGSGLRGHVARRQGLSRRCGGQSRGFLRSASEIHLGAGVFEIGRSVRRHRRPGRNSSRDAIRRRLASSSRPKKRTRARWRWIRTAT